MPSRYTSQMSREDAAQQARTLGVSLSSISIEGMFDGRRLRHCARNSRAAQPDATEENIQARCRGVLLMAISNKTGRMLLTTGNKSEMAVGLCDALRRHGRRLRADQGLQQAAGVPPGALPQQRSSPVDPGARDRARHPRRSCATDQKDTDSLPPYEVLDPDPGGLHRGGPLGRGDLRARLRSCRGRARARHGQACRIQAPPGAARACA